MKTLFRKLAAEWEKTLLWSGLLLMTAVVILGLAGLLRDDAGKPVRSVPAPARHVYLNEATAFAFQDPAPLPPEGFRNPFSFSTKFPAKTAEAAESRPWRKPPPKADPPKADPPKAATGAPPKADPPKAAPTAPKRAVVVRYRGLYSSGDEKDTRQLAFVSTKETPGNTSGMQVVGEGQTVAGITIRRFSADSLVVEGPLGGEVTIAIGNQKKIPLE